MLSGAAADATRGIKANGRVRCRPFLAKVHPTIITTTATTANPIVPWHKIQDTEHVKTDGLTIFASYLDVRLQEKIQLTEGKHFKANVRLPALNTEQEVSFFANALHECDYVEQVKLQNLSIECFLKVDKSNSSHYLYYLEMFTIGHRKDANASLMIELRDLQAETHILNLRPVTIGDNEKRRVVYLIDSQPSEHQDVCYSVEKHQFSVVTVYVTFAGGSTASYKLLNIVKSGYQEFCVAGLFSKRGAVKGAKKYQLTFEIPPLTESHHESKDAAMYIRRRVVPIKGR
ncbi:hypothetical protein TYRP_011379 [Tyrophagus putrescentiae]|nr:hypothetical protein TYRP_011379 [Tyrophagus putrescentiae]